MSDSFVRLQCPGCGAKLEVYPDMERFACGYCGGEILAQRRGGTVALKAVVAAIRQVQKGTDRTAAELALVRLEKELAALRAKGAAISQEVEADLVMSSARCANMTGSLVFGVLLTVIGLATLPAGGCAFVFLVPGVVFLAWWFTVFENSKGPKAERLQREQSRPQRVQDIASQIASIENQIEETKQALSSE